MIMAFEKTLLHKQQISTKNIKMAFKDTFFGESVIFLSNFAVFIVFLLAL